MSQSQDFLVEIGTEELPPKALRRLALAFRDGIQSGIDKAGLGHGDIKWFASPRRLAVLVNGLDTAQQDKAVQRRGPALVAAFGEDGCPTPAAKGFAKSCGVEVEELERLETDKGAWLIFNTVETGEATEKLLPAIVSQSLDQLPIPKRMRWGALAAEFVRPVHWVVMLFGNTVIDTEILSIKTGRETYGHRFHHPRAIYISEPKSYQPLLETEGHVVADFDSRREAIKAQVAEAAKSLNATAVIDEDLLDEVTSMVEWPIAVTGNFEERFLSVPPEVLITTMKENQKYFHVVDSQGKLMPHFITVSNVDSKNIDVIRHGNEKVVRPRLVDAEFFWNQDRQAKLSSRLDALSTVVFQQKLGSLSEKADRVARLSKIIASDIGADPALAEKAALLSKCDLMTDMVGEFPNLQGIMGKYYALHDGEPEEIANAMDEQYQPRFAGDNLPAGKIGQAVAIADRIDSLVGIFAIKQGPSGDKDPFALRRAALGTLRIIIEQRLVLDLQKLLLSAAQNVEQKLKSIDVNKVARECYDFMMDRLRAYYTDTGTAPDVFESVLVQRPAQPYDFDERVRAVSAFRQLPQAESLSAANKRIANILKDQDSIKLTIDPALLKEPAEKDLASTLDKLTGSVEPLFARRDYQKALGELAQLRDSVDSFFDNVMVMVEDEALKNNRLALLGNLRNLFLKVADLSRLQG